MSDAEEKMEIESITSPHHVQRVSKAKFLAIRNALLPALLSEAHVISVAEAEG